MDQFQIMFCDMKNMKEEKQTNKCIKEQEKANNPPQRHILMSQIKLSECL